MNRTIKDVLENLDFVGCDNATARELCAEIERLRGLLREALLPPVRLRVIPQGEDWIKRVREALSDAPDQRD